MLEIKIPLQFTTSLELDVKSNDLESGRSIIKHCECISPRVLQPRAWTNALTMLEIEIPLQFTTSLELDVKSNDLESGRSIIKHCECMSPRVLQPHAWTNVLTMLEIEIPLQFTTSLELDVKSNDLESGRSIIKHCECMSPRVLQPHAWTNVLTMLEIEIPLQFTTSLELDVKSNDLESGRSIIKHCECISPRVLQPRAWTNALTMLEIEIPLQFTTSLELDVKSNDLESGRSIIK